jgi:hypothetical protein
LPRVSSPPRWISSATRSQVTRDSSVNGLVRALPRFKRLFDFSPLTLALSPLRGEGTAVARLADFGAQFATPHVCFKNGFASDTRETHRIPRGHPAGSPSPLNGERAGVRIPRTRSSRFEPQNRNAAFRRQRTLNPPGRRCRLKAAFRGRFVGRGERTTSHAISPQPSVKP